MASTATAEQSRPHLYHVDAVRAVTFLGVVGVHVLQRGVDTSAPTLAGIAAGALLMLGHVTRESFFFLTAFVLFTRHYREPLDMRSFWRRRFASVGVPYLTWTAIYTLAGFATHPRPLLDDLGTGLAAVFFGHYQLYFLVVAAQVYAALPLFVALVRRFEGRHAQLLAASGALEVLLMAGVHAADLHGGEISRVVGASMRLALTYQLYLVAGALAAVHRETVASYVHDHLRVLVCSGAIAAALAELGYLEAVARSVPPQLAADVFQPVMVVWNIGFIAATYAIGSWWARRRRPGLLSTAIERCCDWSFGVYLSHVLVLAALVRLYVAVGRPLPLPWALLGLFAATVTISVALTEAIQRSAWSWLLCGSSRRPQPPAPRPASPNLSRPAVEAVVTRAVKIEVVDGALAGVVVVVSGAAGDRINLQETAQVRGVGAGTSWPRIKSGVTLPSRTHKNIRPRQEKPGDQGVHPTGSISLRYLGIGLVLCIRTGGREETKQQTLRRSRGYRPERTCEQHPPR